MAKLNIRHCCLQQQQQISKYSFRSFLYVVRNIQFFSATRNVSLIRLFSEPRYVNVSSVRGRDTSDCLSTSRTVACRTVEYVLPYIDHGYHIYVETDPAGQDSVMACFTRGRRDEAFENPINRSLTFIGLPNPENMSAMISCPEPRDRFFFFLSEGLFSFNTVGFKNIRLRSFLLTLNGFQLRIEKSEIIDVGIGSNNDYDCSNVGLHIKDSTMTGVTTTPSVQERHASAADIILSGCPILRINLENSRFTDVPMIYLANDPPNDAGLILTVINCEFTMAADSIATDPGIIVFFSEFHNTILVANTSFHDIRFTSVLAVESGVLWLRQNPERQPPAPPSDEQSRIIIAHCTFERNQARPVYVLAPTLNVQIIIRNTTFLHNMALGPGGAISLVNNILSSTNSRVIFREEVFIYLIQSTFRNNTSVNTRQAGGNILLSVSIPIYGNGGAIYSTINASLFTDSCIFVDNVADSLGGAIYNERYSGYILTNNIFQKTSQRHSFRGDFIFGEGFIHFSENNTFIANTSLPGESVIEFNTAPYDRSRNVSAVSPNTQAIVQNVEVFCPVGSSTDLFLIEFNFGGSALAGIIFGSLQGSASRFVVSCVPCESSQYTMQQGRLDFTYQAGGLFSQYELDEVLTVDNITCRSCPYGAACRNGQVTALQDFWGYVDESDGSLNFLQCADGHCCQSSSECTSYDSCTGNRTGVLCGQCLPGFEQALFTTACVRDVHCNDYWIIVPIVVVAVLYVLFLMYVGDLFDFTLTALRWIRDKCSKKKKRQKSNTAAQPGVSPNEYQMTTITTDSSRDSAQPTGQSQDQLLRRLQDTTQHYENVAYVIRRAQQIRESLYPPQDPYAAPAATNVQSGVTTEESREGKSGTSDTGYLGILLYFFQTVFALNLTVIFTSMYHEERASVSIQDTLEKIFNFRITELAVGVCIPGLSEATKLLFMPVYVAFLYTILAVMLGFYKLAAAVSGRGRAGNACCARCNDEGKWNFKSRLTYGMTELLKYTYGLLAEATFTYLTCVSVAGQQVWQSDGSQVCLQPWQWVVLGYAVIYTVPFCLSLWVGTRYLASGSIGARQFILGCLLPFPMLLYWFGKWFIQRCVVKSSRAATTAINSSRNTPANQQVTPQASHSQMQLDILKTLRGPYRDDEDQVTIYWEAVVEFRRLIISMLILIPNDVIRLILATLACIAFLIHHNMIQPFHRFQSNIVETISLLGLCIVSVTGLLQATFTELEAIPRGTHIVILNVMQWISSLMGFVIILSIVVVELVFYLKYQAWKKKMGM